ncbi:MAG: glycosyltransferase family 4 protein [Pyrinomonadaceae bacterium]
MLFLVTLISGAGYGGIQAVNKLIIDVAENAAQPGCVVSWHDAPGVAWARRWPDAICAGGSRLRFVLGALARLRHARGSLIFATHVGLAPLGRIIKHISKGRLLIFLHGVEAWGPIPRITMWGLKGCDLFVTNSQYTLTEFRAQHPMVSEIPGEVCHLPARSLGNGHGHLQERNDNPAGHRVLIVGRIWGRGLMKGQRELISVWPRVLECFPQAELWIVGEGAGRSQLESLAKSLGVDGAVKFTGQVPDVELEAIYRASDLYAMPSRGEGFGLVFAEAMAVGLPCIASKLDAGSEVVVNGETGILVDPANLDELFQAIKELLGDKDLRARMGQAGLRRATEIFSLDNFNQRIERLLNGE